MSFPTPIRRFDSQAYTDLMAFVRIRIDENPALSESVSAARTAYEVIQ